MLTVKRLEDCTPPRLALHGVVDESIDFKALLAHFGTPVHLQCANITRINSFGIKTWNDYFRGFRDAGGKVYFHELSPALVRTQNYLSYFIQPHELISLCAPYLCGACEKLTYKVVTPAEVRDRGVQLAAAPCGDCGATAELDDDPEDYFASILA